MAWFKFDAGSFIADTVGLSDTHVALYVRLMVVYWTSDNRLPDSPAILKRRLGVTASDQEAALEEIMAEFFPGGRHAGLDQQLAEVRGISDKAAQSRAIGIQRQQQAKGEPEQSGGADGGDDEDF